MAQRSSELQRQLIGTFFEEAEEALGQLESGLLAIVNDSSDQDELINDVFRAAHSIKGGAATFGLTEVAELAHVSETLLDQLRARVIARSPDVVRVLLESVDALRALLACARDPAAGQAPNTHDLKQRLQAHAGARSEPATRAAAEAAPEPSATTQWSIEFLPKPEMLETGNDALRLLRELQHLGTLQVETELSKIPSLGQLVPTHCYFGFRMRLEAAVERAQIEEVFSWVENEAQLTIQQLGQQQSAGAAQPSAADPVGPARAQDAPPPEREQAAGSIRVNVNKLDMLMNMVGELVITQSILGELEGDTVIDPKRLASLRDGLVLLARNTRALQESVMSLRSMPIGSVFARLPRLVHDLSQQLGKRVELKLSGQTTEVDKTVLEKLGDPLTHLVRNCLDHGIEKPEVRRARNKPEHGTLEVRAFHRGSDIVVEVEDDGGGLDVSKIVARARSLGLIKPDEQPSEEAARELIFAPGFSTAESVSDVSGRGVGMDVVRRNITSIGGHIHLTSTPGHGTRTVLRLPLTLAIIDGQLIAVGAYTYVIPLLSILESVEIDPARVARFEEGSEIYRLRNELVPMLELRSVLGLGADLAKATKRLMVVVEVEGERIGLIVDELLAQQQVVVKSLEKNYGRVDGLAGATILGDGGVALILDVVGIAHLVWRGRSSVKFQAA